MNTYSSDRKWRVNEPTDDGGALDYVCKEQPIDRKQYAHDLAERQRQHLESIERPDNWRPCMHDNCPQCHGTGRTKQGACIHMISCPCPKCSPTC